MNVALETKTSDSKIGRLDYDNGDLWCAMCGRKKKPQETKLDKRGRVRCRKCGHLVRANPHNKAKPQTFSLG
jgi:DNA-directed RNA polymerase subunit RPC12/RpoP